MSEILKPSTGTTPEQMGTEIEAGVRVLTLNEIASRSLQELLNYAKNNQDDEGFCLVQIDGEVYPVRLAELLQTLIDELQEAAIKKLVESLRSDIK